MQTVRVRLLNDGGYGDAEDVKFPVVVECEDLFGNIIVVSTEELLRVGFDWEGEDLDETWPFSIGRDCEVIS